MWGFSIGRSFSFKGGWIKIISLELKDAKKDNLTKIRKIYELILEKGIFA